MNWHQNARGKRQYDWYKDEVEASTDYRLYRSSNRVELPPGGAWDEETKRETRKVMKEMLQQFESPTNPEDVHDINDLGNKVWKDPERPTRNYWGFSEEGLVGMRAMREYEEKEGFDGPGVRKPVKRARDDTDTLKARAALNSHQRPPAITKEAARLEQARQSRYRDSQQYSRMPPPLPESMPDFRVKHRSDKRDTEYSDTQSFPRQLRPEDIATGY